MGEPTSPISTMRLYGSLIAFISGSYSVYLSTAGSGMSGSAWFMLALGVVVVIHGVVLLTPVATRLGTASGPLMIGYAVLMLLNQGLMLTRDPMGSGMDSGMGSGMNGGMASGVATVDGGMVAIAVLMLASGVIMTVRRGMMPAASTSSTTTETD